MSIKVASRCWVESHSDIALERIGSFLDMTVENEEHANCALIVAPGLEEAARIELVYWSPLLAAALGLGANLPIELMVADHGVLEFRSPLVFALALNHVLKVPTRILLRIATFRCRDFPKLFNKIRKIAWKQYIGSGEVVWEVAATRSRLAVERRIESTCKDGVAAYFKENKELPNESPEISQSIYVRMADDQCTISIDSSGGFLFKRGIRIRVEEAPLRETIAAALIWSVIQETRLNESSARVCLWDPMTGSGCIPLEAAGLLLANCWVQYPFYVWPLFQQTLRKTDLQSSSAFIGKIKNISGASWFSRIAGSDISSKAIASAKANLENFEMLQAGSGAVPVDFFQMDLLNPTIDLIPGNPGWCIINPPYNERLSTGASPGEFYRQLLDVLVQIESVNLIGIIVPSMHIQQVATMAGFSRRPGLRFKNGGIPVELIIFLRM